MFISYRFFFLMIRRPPRSTLSSSSAASDVYKRQVTYTATVTINAPGAGTVTGGTVAFFDNGSPITGCTAKTVTSGTATCVITAGTYNAATTHPITATYGGTTNFAASAPSVALTQTVGAANTTVAVGSSANPSIVGATVTYTATVTIASPGSGTV